MRLVGIRDLKTKVGEVLRSATNGEKVIVTRRGRPVAVILALTQNDLARLIPEDVGWLRAAESSFSFWNNPEDEVWNSL